MGINSIVKLFKQGNVCTCGLRGTGKDVLLGNVIHRRKNPYISNLDYGDNLKKSIIHVPLKLDYLDIKNKYDNFHNGDINEYIYPYPKYCDIYLSDAGVYLPSQYCNELNKKYQGLIEFQQLSRQIGQCNFHINTQNLNRLWDKVREQSDIYIRCNWCKVLFGKIVIQKITLYDKYESCLNRVKPCRIAIPLFGSRESKMSARLYIDNWKNQHGKVKNKILIYKNKSRHDTLYFGDLLSKGGR